MKARSSTSGGDPDAPVMNRIVHEQSAEYFLLDCKDLNEAIGWAAKLPGAQYGSIEIRLVRT